MLEPLLLVLECISNCLSTNFIDYFFNNNAYFVVQTLGSVFHLFYKNIKISSYKKFQGKTLYLLNYNIYTHCESSLDNSKTSN